MTAYSQTRALLIATGSIGAVSRATGRTLAMFRTTPCLFERFRLQSTRRIGPVMLLAGLCLLITPGWRQAEVQALGQDDLKKAAAGFHEFFMHDECTGDYPPQPDTCLHKRLHEHSFTLGGASGSVYDITLRIRGIFEPTTIDGGDAPYPQHPYFRVGGTVKTPEWSSWQIEVSAPKQTYWLNHYPSVSHTIYKEDFEATIAVAAGATVAIRVADGNDRQIDNGEKRRPDRQQIIAGVVDTPLAGQMLRLDVIRVTALRGRLQRSLADQEKR